jgi:hypothetical protein
MPVAPQTVQATQTGRTMVAIELTANQPPSQKFFYNYLEILAV